MSRNSVSGGCGCSGGVSGGRGGGVCPGRVCIWGGCGCSRGVCLGVEVCVQE